MVDGRQRWFVGFRLPSWTEEGARRCMERLLQACQSEDVYVVGDYGNDFVTFTLEAPI